MITNALSVWQRMPDDGVPASERRASDAQRDAACGRAMDSYGCVDWFDFEPAVVVLEVRPDPNAEGERRNAERATA